MDVPHVKREDYQLTDIDENFLVLMSDGGDLREDLKVPEGELGVQLRAEYESGKDLLVSSDYSSTTDFDCVILTDPCTILVHCLEILRRRMCYCN